MINWKRSGPSVISGPKRHSWPDMPEDLPVDILPASNEEYLPPPPSREQQSQRRRQAGTLWVSLTRGPALPNHPPTRRRR